MGMGEIIWTLGPILICGALRGFRMLMSMGMSDMSPITSEPLGRGIAMPGS